MILGGFLYLFDISFSYKNQGVIFFGAGLGLNLLVIIILSPFFLFFYIKQEKKNKLELALTAAVGLSGMFLIGKKGYKKANKILSDILSNEKVKDVAKFASEKASVIISKAKESDAMAKVIEGASSIGNKISNAARTIDEKALQKVGKANIAGAATAAAGSVYISNVDSDKNGVADILEKGVNAYKGAITKMGAIGAVVDLVS